MRSRRSLGGTLGLYSLLLLWTIIVLFPFYFLFTTSFKRPIDFNRVPKIIPWLDFQPINDNWDDLLNTQREQTTRHLRNSLIAATGAMVTTTVIGSMAGYGLSRFKYYWKRLGWRNDNIAYWIVSQRFLPPAVLVIPFLIMYSRLGLVDTHFGLIFAYTAFNLPFTVWIMRDFFNNLPIELEESARVDGANRIQTFLRIVLPLSGPGLITTALFTFIFAWNEYLFALMLTNIDAITLPVYIVAQNSTRGIDWGYIGVLTTLAVVPVLLLGTVLTRYIARGLVAGAIRG